MVRLLIMLIGGALVSVPAVLHGACAQEIQINERTVYYDVAGTSLDAAKRGMSAYAKTHHYDGRKVARTNVNISFRYNASQEALRCSIEAYVVILDLEYLLPKWVDQEKASNADQAEWMLLARSFVRHENTHGEIAKAMAAQASAILSDIRPAGTCGVLSKRAERAVNSYIESSKAQDNYDKYTRNDADRYGFDIKAETRPK